MTIAGSRWKGWYALAASLLVPTSTALGADTSPEAIKAVYILQMQKFVVVGSASRTPNLICYYERPGVPPEESVGQQIERYVHAHAAESPLVVKRFEAVHNFSGCDILFVPAAEESYLNNILAALGNSSTLTVSEVERFILRGGMVGFVEDESHRIRMETNLTNAKAKDVHIDASLLEVMQRVLGR